jgi:SAM-dependent methyltransferase
LVLTETSKINSILDIPCGFGRVARHLRAAFPDASLTCSDLYQDRVDFCEKEFRAKAVKSKEDYDKVEFPEKSDLIWVGSLLSHMPESLFKKAIALLSRSLNPNGVAVFTTQGRHAPFIQKNLWKFIDDDKYPQIETGFYERGFGFADYNAKRQFYEQDHYGITFASPSFVMKCLENDKSIRIQALLERRWDNCQDVVVFKKIGIHAPE